MRATSRRGGGTDIAATGADGVEPLLPTEVGGPVVPGQPTASGARLAPALGLQPG